MIYSDGEERGGDHGSDNGERGKGHGKDKNKWHVPSAQTHGHYPGGQTWGYEHHVEDAPHGNHHHHNHNSQLRYNFIIDNLNTIIRYKNVLLPLIRPATWI